MLVVFGGDCVTVVSGAVSDVPRHLADGDRQLSGDKPVEAMEQYRKGIAAMRDDDDAVHTTYLIESVSLYVNYGTALSMVREDEESLDYYHKALRLHDESVTHAAWRGVIPDATQHEAALLAAQAAFFLGQTYEDLVVSGADDGNREDYRKACADSYALAHTLDPWHWSSFANLGAFLLDHLSRPDDALQAYNRAYNLLTDQDGTTQPTDFPPSEEELRRVLSQLQYRTGCILAANPARRCARTDDPDGGSAAVVSCTELATHAFSLAVDYDPDHTQAAHRLASLTADATVLRAGNDYVTELFEQYATDFERSLVDDLGYDGYERLRRGFDRAFARRDVDVPSFPVVLDAGCGTGLAGAQFRNVSHHLLGVDLSPSILREASKLRPGLYDETRVGDLVDVLRESPGTVSLVVAADSYIYFGDLSPLFAAMEVGVDHQDGMLAFTLENVGMESERSLHQVNPDWRWQLTPSGRFAHRKEYVETVAQQHSFRVFHYESMDGFRQEHGVNVRGHLFIMKKEEGRPPPPQEEL